MRRSNDTEPAALERRAGELRMTVEELRRELTNAGAEAERMAAALAAHDTGPRVWTRLVALACLVTAIVVAVALVVGSHA